MADWFSPTTTTTSGVDPQFMQMYKDVYGKAQGFANQGFTPYTANRVAGLTAPQVQAQNMARQFVAGNVGGEAINSAMAAAQELAGYKPQSLLNVNLQGYMNPYTQNVTDIAMQDLQRANQINQQANAQRAAQAGAFGGSRQGVLEAETNRNYFDTAARTAAGLREKAYENAMGLAGTDITNAMTGAKMQGAASELLSNLGLTQRGIGMENIDLLNKMGEQQRAIDQGQLTANYEDFIRKMNYPKEQLSYLTNALSSMQPGTITNKTETPATLSAIQSAAGLAGVDITSVLKSLLGL
jgi:hypothetical protein